MFVSLERLGSNPNCLFQEAIAEGAHSDLAAVGVGIKIPSTSCVGIKIPQEQYGHWHHPGSDGMKRRKAWEAGNWRFQMVIETNIADDLYRSQCLPASLPSSLCLTEPITSNGLPP